MGKRWGKMGGGVFRISRGGDGIAAITYRGDICSLQLKKKEKKGKNETKERTLQRRKGRTHRGRDGRSDNTRK